MSRYKTDPDEEEEKESEDQEAQDQGGTNWSDPNNDDLSTTLAIIP